MPTKKEPKVTKQTWTKDPNHEFKRIFYVRESAAQSIIADTFTFGILIGITTLNYQYWGGHWYMNIFILFLWLVFVGGRAKSKGREFHSRSELIDHLIAELEAEGETSK